METDKEMDMEKENGSGSQRGPASAKDRFYAIIPAAGRGTRMGMPVNKQFLEIGGAPILARTLSAFEECAVIDGILIAGNEDEIPLLRDLCAKYRITKLIGIAPGGSTRLRSVMSAISALAKLPGMPSGVGPSAADGEEAGGQNVYVLIHDGARPFVSDSVIRACAAGAVLHGACVCGVPVKDTIKVVDREGRIVSTVPRDGLWAVQTPQAFRFPLISDLCAKAAALNLDFTDDAQAAEHFGIEVQMIRGDYSNIKITTPDDLSLGETILRRQDRR